MQGEIHDVTTVTKLVTNTAGLNPVLHGSNNHLSHWTSN